MPKQAIRDVRPDRALNDEKVRLSNIGDPVFINALREVLGLAPLYDHTMPANRLAANDEA
jgi:hypothetical protein